MSFPKVATCDYKVKTRGYKVETCSYKVGTRVVAYISLVAVDYIDAHGIRGNPT